MVDRSDIYAVDDNAWERAVGREAIIRKLASKATPDRADFLSACRELGLKRSRLYDLIRAYKARPVTSSLLIGVAGSRVGSRRLSEDVEAVISAAIEEFFMSLQKPSINALRKEVRRRCRQRGLRAPCWTALRDRVAAMDQAKLAAAREGAKAARSRYHPVPGAYQVDGAFEVV
jgi:putative transposase